MNAKIYCEHHWVHPYDNLHYEVSLKTSAPATGYGFIPRLHAIYGQPFVTVMIGGDWMGDEPLQGDPAMTEMAAWQFVDQRLKIWEGFGLFGPHLSQELSLRGSEVALALFRNALEVQ
jgi:hypothetical protein